MSAVISVSAPASAREWETATRLVQEYASSLPFDLGFQNFAREIESLASEYGPPDGAFVLAWRDGVAAGCGGLRRFDERSCEMKRLYVVPAHRGLGIGRAIVQALIGRARVLGYHSMLLDTVSSMHEAHALYASSGFALIAAYRHNPIEGASFWKLDLQPISIVRGGLDDPRVHALLEYHVRTARAATAPGSDHALDLSGLKSPDVTFWSAWDGDTLAGVGALKTLSPDHGEIKSMHTAEASRRSGVGSAMLRHIIAEARTMGLRRLSLETGSWDYFRPAHALYRKHGFAECGPFGDYVEDPNSIFMTLDLGA